MFITQDEITAVNQSISRLVSMAREHGLELNVAKPNDHAVTALIMASGGVPKHVVSLEMLRTLEHESPPEFIKQNPDIVRSTRDAAKMSCIKAMVEALILYRSIE